MRKVDRNLFYDNIHHQNSGFPHLLFESIHIMQHHLTISVVSNSSAAPLMTDIPSELLWIIARHVSGIYEMKSYTCNIYPKDIQNFCSLMSTCRRTFQLFNSTNAVALKFYKELYEAFIPSPARQQPSYAHSRRQPSQPPSLLLTNSAEALHQSPRLEFFATCRSTIPLIKKKLAGQANWHTSDNEFNPVAFSSFREASVIVLYAHDEMELFIAILSHLHNHDDLSLMKPQLVVGASFECARLPLEMTQRVRVVLITEAESIPPQAYICLHPSVFTEAPFVTLQDRLRTARWRMISINPDTTKLMEAKTPAVLSWAQFLKSPAGVVRPNGPYMIFRSFCDAMHPQSFLDPAYASVFYPIDNVTASHLVTYVAIGMCSALRELRKPPPSVHIGPDSRVYQFTVMLVTACVTVHTTLCTLATLLEGKRKTTNKNPDTQQPEQLPKSTLQQSGCCIN